MSAPSQRGPALPYQLIAGVEPCRGGWLVASGRVQGANLMAQQPEVYSSFLEVLDAKPAFSVIAVHIPIGLLDEDQPGGRTCDREARRLLGHPRASAILTPPTRAALGAANFAEAHELTQGLSALQWARMTHIAEVDREIQPYWQRTVYEVNPELAFFQLNQDKPLTYGKRTLMGRAERSALLSPRISGIDMVLGERIKGVRSEQLVDAVADLWTARRILGRAVARLPQDPEWDENALRMELIR